MTQLSRSVAINKNRLTCILRLAVYVLLAWA